MGWTYTHRETRESLLEFFRSEFSGENHEIVACAPVGFTECYVALRLAHALYEAMSEPPVVAVAVMIHHCPQSYYNFGYKALDEEMGPTIDRCPEKIMRLLTPVRDLVRGEVYTGKSQIFWVRQWRARCWRNIVLRKRRVPFGTWIEFRKPQVFNGWEETRFQRTRYGRQQNVFRTEGGRLVRFRSNWRTGRYRVIKPEEERP